MTGRERRERRSPLLALATSARVAAGIEPGAVEPCYVRQSEAEINLKLGRLEGARTP